MTQRQAWTFLASLWEKPILRGVATIDNFGCMGLCACITTLSYNGHISKWVAYCMGRRIAKEGRRLRKGQYLWPHTDEGYKQRAEFCKTQAKRRSLWDWFLCR